MCSKADFHGTYTQFCSASAHSRLPGRKMLPSLITLLIFLFCTCGENPAVRFILTDKGLQYGKHVGAGWVQDKLGLITLPDISGEIPISIFGTLDYTLTGTTITKCDFPEPSVEFDQNVTGFKTSISGLSVAMTGSWMSQYLLIESTGSFNIAVFGVGVTSVLKLGKDADGHLSITCVICDANVGDVDLQVNGGISAWIFQHAVNHYKEQIRSEIEGRICSGVKEFIMNMEHHLEAMNVSFDVDQYVTLELPLTDLPDVNTSSLNLGFKGEFYSTRTHKDPPFEAQPFAVPQQPDYMLSVSLSEYTLNSASYGYYSSGLFQVLVNDSMIPPYIPVRLNTSYMGHLVPQLPKMFPGLMMNLQVYAREFPLFLFHPAAVSLGVLGAIKAFAIQPNGTKIPLFTLNVNSEFSSKAWITDGKLKGSVGMSSLTLTLASSEVGSFKTDALERLVRMGSVVAMMELNERLGNGVDLPRMKQAELVNTVLELYEGFIAISTDAQILLT
ncbi:bactericidal permeability-increasing protein [Antennarius striatus]|uniref:bactericidal permeability-increasing protein n=1 Tax=Antennarius striatus TaxID=241820 RepID=UPI0035B2E952